jgi:hypothetical protein
MAYIRPIEEKYAEGLAASRKKTRARIGVVGQRVMFKVAERVSVRISGELIKRIEDGRAASAFLLALGLALMNDLGADAILEWLGIATIVGYFATKTLSVGIDLITGLILFTSLYQRGPAFKKNKVRLVLYPLWFLEMTPLGLFPLWTVTVLYTWYSVRKDGRVAEAEFDGIKKGTRKISEAAQLSADVAI